MKELQEVFKHIDGYPKELERLRHYQGMAWEAAHMDDIREQLEKIATPEMFVEAIGEQEPAALQKAIKLMLAEDWHQLGLTVGLTVHAYLWKVASEQVLENQELQDDFELEEHASLTDAERNGVTGVIKLSDL